MNTINDIQQDLLETILNDDDLYPWNPADSDTEAYFEQQEACFSLTDCLALEDISQRAQTLLRVCQA